MIDPLTNPGAAPRIYQETAWCLVGKPVAVLISSNDLRKRVGLFTWEDSETGTITIRPGLIEESIYQVFLHECAHAKLHWPLVGKPDPELTEQVDKAMSGEDQSWLGIAIKKMWEGPINAEEREANDLAAKWDDAASLALGQAATCIERLGWLRNTSYQNPNFLENPPATTEEGTQNE